MKCIDMIKRCKYILPGTTLAIIFIVTLVTSCGTTSTRLRTSSSSANIHYVIDSNGIATLFGNVDDSFERYEATRLVKKIEGVEKVNNLLTFSN